MNKICLQDDEPTPTLTPGSSWESPATTVLDTDHGEEWDEWGEWDENSENWPGDQQLDHNGHAQAEPAPGDLEETLPKTGHEIHNDSTLDHQDHGEEWWDEWGEWEEKSENWPGDQQHDHSHVQAEPAPGDLQETLPKTGHEIHNDSTLDHQDHGEEWWDEWGEWEEKSENWPGDQQHDHSHVQAEPAPADLQETLPKTGHEIPVLLGSIPFSKTWAKDLHEFMDKFGDCKWWSCYAMGGGWRLDFVGEWKLKHVPCKSQFPLYVYAMLDEDDMEHQDSDHDDEFHGLDDNTGDLPDCYIADPNPKELLPDNQLGDRDLYPESEPGGPFPPHDDDDDNQGCDDEGPHTYSTTSDAMCPWHEGEWANDGPWAGEGSSWGEDWNDTSARSQAAIVDQNDWPQDHDTGYTDAEWAAWGWGKDQDLMGELEKEMDRMVYSKEPPSTNGTGPSNAICKVEYYICGLSKMCCFFTN